MGGCACAHVHVHVYMLQSHPASAAAASVVLLCTGRRRAAVQVCFERCNRVLLGDTTAQPHSCFVVQPVWLKNEVQKGSNWALWPRMPCHLSPPLPPSLPFPFHY